MKRPGALRTYAGLLVLAGAMAFSVVRVGWSYLTYEAPDVRTVRLCHWQLEAGFRDALQKLIDEYQEAYAARTGRKVRILQIPVSERGYQQYVNTGMVGGTAPDIVEKGKAKTALDPSYVARFYLPLSRFLAEPNPYNAGTELAGVPWRDSFIDGMASCYDYVLGDYYYVPFSMFTIRIYYNADLFEKATGRSQPPDSYVEFIKCSREIRDYGERLGTRLTPIAGGKQRMVMFRIKLERTFHRALIDLADENGDLYVDPLEAYRAYLQGKWDFRHPALQASWKCMAEIGAQFQDGWLAAERDDAVFMFAQQRAVMYASGSWDASSIIEQVGDNFRVGVMEFPLPVDHPEFGRYVRGPATEANLAGGIPWSINARSRNVDLCVDFLRFCTTRANNQRFNNAITWIPVVRGARLDERLKPFRPRIEGFCGNFDYYNSSAVRLIGEGSLWTMYAGGISPEEYAGRLTEAYERSGDEGSREWIEQLRQRGRNTQRILGGLHLQQLRAGPSDAAVPADKYQQVLLSVQSLESQVAVYSARLEAARRRRPEARR